MTRRKPPEVTKPSSPTSEFIFAAKCGNLTAVKNFIDKGVNPNIFYDDNNALFIAVEASNVALVLLLTYYKTINVNVQNQQNDTPLMIACTYNPNIKIVKMLLNAGAKTNVQNNFGRTPLHAAIHHDSLVIAKELIKHGANPNIFDEFGNTPLYFACVENKNYAIAKYLLLHNADPNLQSVFSLPLFIDVCLSTRKDLDIVKLLVEHGVDVNVTERVSKKNALHFASQTCNVHLVIYLITMLDVYQKDASGRNPMMIAKQNQCPEVSVLFSDFLVGQQIKQKEQEMNRI